MKITFSGDEIGYIYQYNEEKKKLMGRFKMLGGLDESSLDHEFHTLIVFQYLPSGQIFWGTSAGCSCPNPFEEYFVSIDEEDENVISTNFDEIVPSTFPEFESSVNAFPDELDTKRELLLTIRSMIRDPEGS